MKKVDREKSGRRTETLVTRGFQFLRNRILNNTTRHRPPPFVVVKYTRNFPHPCPLSRSRKKTQRKEIVRGDAANKKKKPCLYYPGSGQTLRDARVGKYGAPLGNVTPSVVKKRRSSFVLRIDSFPLGRLLPHLSSYSSI